MEINTRLLTAALASIPLLMLLAWFLWAALPERFSPARRAVMATGLSLAFACATGTVIWYLKQIH